MRPFQTHFHEGLAKYLRPWQMERLEAAKIGIAGLGGLGSNIAMMLARSGIGQFVLIDDDCVDKSNLNRQHYWPRHLHLPKAEALRESLLELNPALRIESSQIRLDAKNLDAELCKCAIWAEAMDGAESKALFVEKALLAGQRVVAASGICGIGGQPMRRRTMGKLVIVGDFDTSVEKAPPMAPRVNQAAALMADVILEWILYE